MSTATYFCYSWVGNNVLSGSKNLLAIFSKKNKQNKDIGGIFVIFFKAKKCKHVKQNLFSIKFQNGSICITL